MIPLDVFGSESVAATLLAQVRWRDGVECPRCRSDLTVKNGSYGTFQRYLCKDCDRSFNDKTGTIFAHSKIALRKWLFSIYAFLRFNTSIRQLQVEIDVTYKTIHRRIERFSKALDAPSLDLVGPVEIDEVYVTAGTKGRERDGRSRSRGLSTRGRGIYEGDKPPVVILVDRGTDQRYVVPAKTVDESTNSYWLAASRSRSPSTPMAFERTNRSKMMTHSTVNTSSTVTANTLTALSTSTPVRATGRCCDRGSRPIEASRRIS